jgi:hypothetical protein
MVELDRCNFELGEGRRGRWLSKGFWCGGNY